MEGQRTVPAVCVRGDAVDCGGGGRAEPRCRARKGGTSVGLAGAVCQYRRRGEPAGCHCRCGWTVSRGRLAARRLCPDRVGAGLRRGGDACPGGIRGGGHDRARARSRRARSIDGDRDHEECDGGGVAGEGERRAPGRAATECHEQPGRGRPIRERHLQPGRLWRLLYEQPPHQRDGRTVYGGPDRRYAADEFARVGIRAQRDQPGAHRADRDHQGPVLDAVRVGGDGWRHQRDHQGPALCASARRRCMGNVRCRGQSRLRGVDTTG